MKTIAVLLIALTASLAMNAYQALTVNACSEWHSSEYQEYVQRAIQLWSLKSGESKFIIHRYRFAKTIKLGNEVCVNLAIRPGSLGGEPTYCFDATSGKLTRQLDEVD